MKDENAEEPEGGGEAGSALGAAARRMMAGYSRLREEDGARAAKDRAAVEDFGPQRGPDRVAAAKDIIDAGARAAEATTTRRTDVDKAMQETADRGEPDTRVSYPVGEPNRPDFEGAGGYVYRKTPDGVMIVKSPDGRIDGLVIGPEGKNEKAYAAIMAEMEGAKK